MTQVAELIEKIIKVLCALEAYEMDDGSAFDGTGVHSEGLKVAHKLQSLFTSSQVSAEEVVYKLMDLKLNQGVSGKSFKHKEAVAIIQAAMLANAQTCEWLNDGGGVYETGCKNLFEVNEGTATDNDMKFCCYCAGKIIETSMET